jgi:23S rRNA (adenine2503-C2)-methyltransferase
MTKKSIFNQEALEEFRKEHKIQPYRMRQIENAIFQHHIIDFNQMTTLSKELREKLSAEFEIIPFTLKTTKEDDETSKFLFKAKSGEVFEAVLLFHQHEVDGEQKLNRITLCISSQVGCAVGCVFCVT